MEKLEINNITVQLKLMDEIISSGSMIDFYVRNACKAASETLNTAKLKETGVYEVPKQTMTDLIYLLNWLSHEETWYRVNPNIEEKFNEIKTKQKILNILKYGEK